MNLSYYKHVGVLLIQTCHYKTAKSPNFNLLSQPSNALGPVYFNDYGCHKRVFAGKRYFNFHSYRNI